MEERSKSHLYTERDALGALECGTGDRAAWAGLAHHAAWVLGLGEPRLRSGARSAQLHLYPSAWPACDEPLWVVCQCCWERSGRHSDALVQQEAARARVTRPQDRRYL